MKNYEDEKDIVIYSRYAWWHNGNFADCLRRRIDRGYTRRSKGYYGE